jgi:murein L,D-transpeptidase YafK
MRSTFALMARGAGAVLLVAGLAACGTYQTTPSTPFADRVVIEKGKRQMHLMQNGTALRSYRVALGGDPVGHKTQQGDSRTPEGVYTVDFRRSQSRFNLALRIDYPNARDRQIAAARGVDPGGEIYIHGQPNGGVSPARLAQTGPDWTDGCIAVTNREMQEVWAMVRIGTPVEIRP